MDSESGWIPIGLLAAAVGMPFLTEWAATRYRGDARYRVRFLFMACCHGGNNPRVTGDTSSSSLRCIARLPDWRLCQGVKEKAPHCRAFFVQAQPET